METEIRNTLKYILSFRDHNTGLFNASRLSGVFGKQAGDFISLKETLEYAVAVEDFYNFDPGGAIVLFEDEVYLANEMLQEFMRWADVNMAIEIDLWILRNRKDIMKDLTT